MRKWQRINYQPVLPLGENGKRITASKEHSELSRKAAASGMVLLKNQNKALPLKEGEKVVLLGKGTADYVKGGGGSGDVYTDYVHSLIDGMLIKETERKVDIYKPLFDFYKKYVEEKLGEGYMCGMMTEPDIPKDLLEGAKDFATTAIISISRYSGEGWDRRVGTDDDIRTEYAMWPGEEEQREIYKSVFNSNDFYLTDQEEKVLQTAKDNFDKVIVVLNIGGVIDTNWTFDKAVDGVLISWQGGMEGGLATADVLCGDENPSGHLSDTFAKNLSDYPSTKDFHLSADYVVYNEDIYVGYRYFETIPGAKEKVNYPFGFGLSYSSFKQEILESAVDGDRISFKVKVTNTGDYSGKDVVQIYYGAPSEIIQKSARELICFAKTKVLDPGMSEDLTLEFLASDMKTFDDTGKIEDASWVMEKGTYHFFVGSNVRDAVCTDLFYELTDNRVLETTGHKLSPTRTFDRLLADGSLEKVNSYPVKEDPCKMERQEPHSVEGWQPEIKGLKSLHIAEQNSENPKFIDVYEGKISLDEFINYLSVKDKIDLLGGQYNTGVAVTSGVGNNIPFGIPNVMTADGPAGLRITEEIGVSTTAWPIETNLACTWDLELVERIGKEAALEIKENNLGLWLAPACNIHRSPLCGRNFEYFSEDPFLTGKMATAIIKGTQSEQIGATPKHFAANNKETNRKASDSVVSERALREIYLKQFEMLVKDADPYLIMSSYNKINGVQASENEDLLTGILRKEWGYKGPVSTDWWTLGEQYVEIKAGNDLKMACGYPHRVMEAYEKGYISEEEINLSVKRILNMILRVG